ncbi:MAG: 4-hydroxy-tetrahydrodipicolinate reductase [Calditrichia bacterium]
MIQLVINGIGGRMGQEVVRLVRESSQYTVVGGVDPLAGESLPDLIVTTNPGDIVPRADVVIDFSTPEGALTILDFCTQFKKPLVTGTTGFETNELDRFHQAAQTIPIVQAFNFSIGINLMLELVAKAARIIGKRADVEIVEMHHRNKKDAPSGTALLLARAMVEALENQSEPILRFGRQGRALERENEIGIHSLRGGSVIGEHQVHFLGTNENIVLTHQALNRRLFVEGALLAAEWVVKKNSGYFGMKDVLGFN